MNAERGCLIFKELTTGLRLNARLVYHRPEMPEDDERGMGYSIEIQTPLPRGTSRDLLALKSRYMLTEIRIPVRHRNGAPIGKIIWQ